MYEVSSFLGQIHFPDSKMVTAKKPSEGYM